LDLVLFNIHDIVLIVVIFEGLMLACLLAALNKGKKLSNLLLSGFLLLNAGIAYEVLIYWCVPVNQLLSSISPDLYFLFGFAYFLQGPALYWYVKSFIYRDFSLGIADVPHLLPALAYWIFIYFTFYSQPADYKLSLIHDFNQLYASAHFKALFYLQRVTPVLYAALCLRHMTEYKNRLQDSYSNIEVIDFSWLKLFASLFLLTWLWALLTEISGQFVPDPVSNVLGIIHNYLILILVNALVVYSLSNSDVFEGIRMENAGAKPDIGESALNTYTALLKQSIEQDQPYLDPDLTLEQLAHKLSMSPKTLSAIINRDFKQNFFEFINHYRVEQVKRLLAENVYQPANIQEIMLRSGFNSKSAFNRFFKKFVGITPSAYRKQQVQ
jgi:AraC-like DNA-binding protein